jgi:hypothetical protein
MELLIARYEVVAQGQLWSIEGKYSGFRKKNSLSEKKVKRDTRHEARSPCSWLGLMTSTIFNKFADNMLRAVYHVGKQYSYCGFLCKSL